MDFSSGGFFVRRGLRLTGQPCIVDLLRIIKHGNFFKSLFGYGLDKKDFKLHCCWLSEVGNGY